MIRNLIFLLVVVNVTNVLAFDKNSFLNVAVLTLPERYLADIPKSQRTAFLINVSDYFEPLVDYKHGRLNFFSDSGDGDFGTSPLLMKLLPRKGDYPLVFVHMPNNDTGINKTFILERDGSQWNDVTAQVIPKGVDLTEAFFPRLATPDIDVALEKNRKGRQDYIRMYELIWNGASFKLHKASKKKLSRKSWLSKVAFGMGQEALT